MTDRNCNGVPVGPTFISYTKVLKTKGCICDFRHTKFWVSCLHGGVFFLKFKIQNSKSEIRKKKEMQNVE
jgi:hypothetical protein